MTAHNPLYWWKRLVFSDEINKVVIANRRRDFFGSLNSINFTDELKIQLNWWLAEREDQFWRVRSAIVKHRVLEDLVRPNLYASSGYTRQPWDGDAFREYMDAQCNDSRLKVSEVWPQYSYNLKVLKTLRERSASSVSERYNNYNVPY